jgi:hypothetical protein
MSVRRRRRGVLEEKACRQRATLRRRHLDEHLVERLAEEIADARECKLGVRLGRPGRHDSVPARACAPDRLVPDAGLADPRLALEEERVRSLPDQVEKRLDCVDLCPTANERVTRDRGCHQRPAASSVRDRTPSLR